MNWWWNNPLGTMYGPYFLALYAAVIVTTVTVARWIVRSGDSTRELATPTVPESPDPYLLAYLRGGKNEVARLALFDLLHRGVLRQTTRASFFGWSQKDYLGLVANSELKGLPPLLRSMAKWVGREREARSVFSDGIGGVVQDYAEAVQRKAERLNLATPQEELASRRMITVAAFLIVLALGAYKFVAAWMTEHRNVTFLVALGVAGCVLVPWLASPRKLTHLGCRTLQAMQTAFEGLKSDFRQDGTYDPRTVLAMGIFGIAVLQGTAYGAFHDLFRHSAGSSSGCGSSCGSGCGGGGCGGGGCGGCGS